MAEEDKIEQELFNAINRLYVFSKQRPSTASVIAKQSMNALADLLGYDLVFVPDPRTHQLRPRAEQPTQDSLPRPPESIS